MMIAFILEGCLAAALADVAIKTTYTIVYLLGREFTILHCQIDTVPTPNAVLVAKTVLPIAVTSDFCRRSLKFSITVVGLGILT